MKPTKARNRAANAPAAKRKTKPPKQESAASEIVNETGTKADFSEFCLEQFAGALDTARGLWRRYPELVEVPDFPEPFLSACSSVESGIAGEKDLLQAGILKAQQATDEQKRFKMPTPKELRAKLQSIRENLGGPGANWTPEAHNELNDYVASIMDLSMDDERNFIAQSARDIYADDDSERKAFVARRRGWAMEFLAICRVIHHAHDDCNTPGEHLIEQLVSDYFLKGALTPEMVQEHVDGFVGSFECDIREAKRVIEEYPDLFTPEALERELV